MFYRWIHVFLGLQQFLVTVTIVEAQEHNFAPEGTASQSTEWNRGQFPAGNAIDGRSSSFSHTDADTVDNHWRLAFAAERRMDRIEIVARQDCCAGRLTNAVMRLLDDDGGSVFDAAIVDPGPGETVVYSLPAGTFGKSIRIGFENGDFNPQGNRVLHLAEVRVIQDDSEPFSIDTFETSTTHIANGESILLSWEARGAESVELVGVGEFPPTGQTTLTPVESTEFILVATTESGAKATALTSVIVDDKPLPLLISEFMAASSGGASAVFEGDDWIEIHNPSPGAVPLSGYTLTDTADHSIKWPFPSNFVLTENGFVLVRASGIEADDETMQASFRLAREAGSYLALLAPDGNAISTYTYPEQRAGVSFGSDDGDAPVYFLQPTPGSINEGTGFQGFVADTQFSVDRGFYSESFDLAISTQTEGASILVTLDGSRPDPGNPSTFIYTIPLNIEGTSVVRAAAYLDGLAPTNINTQTYLFISDVLEQPQQPAGFPPSWGDVPGVVASVAADSDYEMDPRIVDDAPFTDLDEEDFDWNDALRAIPTMSLVLPIGDLLDPEDGLHARATNRGRAWEREASLEIIDPVRGTSVQAGCGLRMQGGWNRFPEMLKKSMRLYFRGEYGDPKLRYPLFEDSEVAEFDRLVLRSGNGKAWPSPWRSLSGNGNSLTRTTYLRDQFVRDTQRDLGHPIAHGNFVHLYINGLYWGLYNPVERLDEKYASAHFGGDEADYDIVKWIRGLGGLQLVSGSAESWDEMINRVRKPMTDRQNYEEALELLDPVNLTDYMIANMYAGNSDWQDNNAYAMRNRNVESGGDGKWRFFSWDAEETFLSTTADSTRQNASNTATFVYGRLRANEDFKLLFGDRLYRAFFNGGALSVAGADQRWMRLARWIDHAIVAESARWGDLRRPSNPYDRGDWEREILNIRENYIGNGRARNRTTITLGQFAKLGLYPDLEPPRVLPQRGGVVEPGHLAQLESPPPQVATVYYTLDGSDPRAPGGAASESAQPFLGGSIPVTVIRSGTETVAGSEWKYLDTGEDLSATAWTQTQFDDSTWQAGPSELGYGDRDEHTVVSFGPNVATKFITTYFRHTFDLFTATGTSTSQQVTGLNARIKFDDGAIVYINGTEVARFFLPAGPVDAQTPALSGSDENAFADIAAIDHSLLQAGKNTIAVEVHQLNRTNSDISFDMEFTVRAVPDDAPPGITIDRSLTLKARSFDKDDWSALQEVEFTVGSPTSGLAISEIYYAPTTGHAAGAEFIELLNRGDTPVDLTGVHFTEGISFQFGKRTLASGDRVVVVRDRQAFAAAFPSVTETRIAGTFAGGTALNNGGERIELRDANSSVIATIEYGTRFPWPEEAGGHGYSLTWIEGADPQLPESWRTSVGVGGSPGFGDSLPAPAEGANLIDYALAAPPKTRLRDGTALLELHSVPGSDSVDIVIELSEDLIEWTAPAIVQRLSSSRRNSDAIVSVYQLGEPAGRAIYYRLKLSSR